MFFRLFLSVKDKAEILLQVEELVHIKEELSSQVCNTERGIWSCLIAQQVGAYE